jgi:hypothetical protein
MRHVTFFTCFVALFISQQLLGYCTTMSFATPTFQVAALAALLLFLIFSRRHRLPPGPRGNVAGEFKNATMPEVFEKWRRKYGA